MPSSQIYYPSFGSSIATRAYASGAYRYGFNGKEKDPESFIDAYDFGARIYDGRLGRWLSLDPLMGKYPQFTPFNFCINSTLNIINYDGRDIIVLHAKQQFNEEDGASGADHPTGHMAVLIQGKDAYGNEGWWYYSHDGPKKDNSDGYTKMFFNTIGDFKKSEHNRMKENYDDGKGTNTSEKDKLKNVRTRYENAIRIMTTSETDKKMNEVADKQIKTKYILLLNDCRHLVDYTLNASDYLTPSPPPLSFPKIYFELIKLLVPYTNVDTKNPESSDTQPKPSNLPKPVGTPRDATTNKLPIIPLKKK